MDQLAQTKVSIRIVSHWMAHSEWWKCCATCAKLRRERKSATSYPKVPFLQRIPPYLRRYGLSNKEKKNIFILGDPGIQGRREGKQYKYLISLGFESRWRKCKDCSSTALATSSSELWDNIGIVRSLMPREKNEQNTGMAAQAACTCLVIK